MHNLHIYDCGQQLIKVNSNGSKPLFWVDDSILENSLLEFIDSSIMQKTGNSYYTGGIDIHGGKNWRIRDNTFRNIQRKGKLMEHAVHLWSKSRDSIVERNRFINCYRGIGFGMKLRPEGHVRQYPDKKGNKPYFDHVGGVIRNNAIFNSRGIHLESGIELMNVIDVKVVHNTVVSVDKPFACIEYRWPNTRLSIYNNLVSHSILVRNNAKAKLGSNITHAPRGMFINYGKGNVHLSKNAKQAINQGKKYKGILVVDDLERKKRDMKPDIGAYEY